jgi:ubiquinol-cytochrome c reductase cytochrome b subunit
MTDSADRTTRADRTTGVDKATDADRATDADKATELERMARWFDERTGIAGIVRIGLRKVFPDHWSFLLGEIALFTFVILVLTGTYLAFFYVPDTTPTQYTGPYAPLQGTDVSAAFDSVMRLSFEVRAGLVMRQIHHWTALVFVAAIVLHLSRVFFTGAFRRPRELNWLIGFTMLTLAMAMGFTGYSLPDDLLSGTGLRIAYSAALSIPFIGPWFAALFFGGEFPTADIISRLFVFHIFLLPAAMIGLITAHLAILVVQKHTQYKVSGATEANVLGRHFWPGQVFRSTGLFFLIAAVVSLLGGLVQINPVWLYGPFIPYAVSSPAQPDWYIGWLEGALRLAPAIEPTIPVVNVTIPATFTAGVLIPGLLFTIVAIWPFIEARFTRDKREHHLLDWPWEAPRRSAFGAAILTFFGVLTLAGANDIISAQFDVPVENVTTLFRILLLGLPPLVWLLVYRLAVDHAQAETIPRHAAVVTLHREPGGGFDEFEEP